MKKSISKIISCGVCLTMAAVFTAGCTPPPTGSGADPETRPFVVAIGATDGVFSPFFATSQYDTQVTELTQISMLTSDENGNIACGENQPTVVLDYTQTMFDANDNVTTAGDINGYTVYEFVIKNGIKFSDGVDLTIKDVLFNLYVYLDPVYFGSSTIYSTKIKGLAAYRNQSYDASADSSNSAYFQATAASRLDRLVEYLDEGTYTSSFKEQIDKDIVTLKELFKEELSADWSSVYGTLDTYTEEYNFNSNWEIFYLNEGFIRILTKQIGSNWEEQKDDNGKYLTSLDEEGNQLRKEIEDVIYDESKIAEKMAEYECDHAQAKIFLERDTAIDNVYQSYIRNNSTLYSIFEEGWSTVGTLEEKFVRDAMTDYYNEMRENGGLAVKNISGIKAIKSADSVTYKNKYTDNDILQITIDGVDPKAIWNFAFQVAPAHYYSAKAGEYDSTDYTDIDIANNQFGVRYSDANFFDDVLNATSKKTCPVGAGAYQTCNSTGEPTRNGSAFHPTNGTAYYVRNEYFTTVGSGIDNAKIKYFRYKEVEDAALVQVLKNGEVDYGEPNCTLENINALSGGSVKLGYKTPMSASYGYVGVNPKYIPDMEVRQAIMQSMRVMQSVNYYGTKYASALYRPMSKANWVYTKYITKKTYSEGERAGIEKGTKYDTSYYSTLTAAQIEANLNNKGWHRNSSGKLEKDGKTLKYTFTIAGGTTNHPAYTMFNNAASILNDAGFDIKVRYSNQALQKLATGSLEVWAAAYTSPVDPDLYQLYHKDSKASSVKNWGYEAIKSDTTGIYSKEKEILESLSTHILEARQYLAEDKRGPIYLKALDEIMELAIQLPTYQRSDLAVYNQGLLAASSLNTNPTAYAGVLNKIWKVNYS